MKIANGQKSFKNGNFQNSVFSLLRPKSEFFSLRSFAHSRGQIYSMLDSCPNSYCERKCWGRGNCIKVYPWGQIAKRHPHFKGRGVLGRFSLFDCFWWRRTSATRNFFQNGKMMFLAKVITLHTITLRAGTLIAISRKSTQKYIFFYIFRDKCLKLGGYVLGTKNKLSSDQILI